MFILFCIKQKLIEIQQRIVILRWGLSKTMFSYSFQEQYKEKIY